jgi:hypothetical protein
MNSVVKFLMLLVVALTIAFGLHLLSLYFLKFPLFDNSIFGCYFFNAIVAVLTVLVLTLLQHKAAGSLGYIFMLSSLVKFGLFFIIFYPAFKEDGDINRLEFTSFFIPYAISLIVEVIFLSKTLNK